MLQKIKSPFKLEKESKSRSQCIIKHSSVAVGLRICTEISQTESNVVVKSALRLRQPSSASRLVQPSCVDYCFLKTCHLCNKKLCPNKDIYMYRGDQGFCSVECRNRQIVLDEMKELEASTKQMLASYRHHRCSSGRSETLMILEDLRSRRRNPLASHKNGAIVS